MKPRLLTALGLAPALLLVAGSALLPAFGTQAEANGWTEYALPGGSGTVALPPGWRLTSSNDVGCFEVAGPGDQAIHVGLWGNVAEPSSIYSNGAQYGALVAPFSDPVTAIINLAPQWDRLKRSQGGTGFILNQILRSVPVQGEVGGQAALVWFDWTKTSGSLNTPMRGYSRLECLRGAVVGIWSYQGIFAEGPRETFDQATPTFQAILNSWKTNSTVIAENAQRHNKASQDAMDQSNARWLEVINN